MPLPRCVSIICPFVKNQRSSLPCATKDQHPLLIAAARGEPAREAATHVEHDVARAEGPSEGLGVKEVAQGQRTPHERLIDAVRARRRGQLGSGPSDSGWQTDTEMWLATVCKVPSASYRPTGRQRKARTGEHSAIRPEALQERRQPIDADDPAPSLQEELREGSDSERHRPHRAERSEGNELPRRKENVQFRGRVFGSCANASRAALDLGTGSR